MFPDFRLLQQAIDERRNISARYQRHLRLMTPHTLGWKKDREHCLFYQFGGNSLSQNRFNSNSPENWRCVRVEELYDIKIIEGEIQTCDRHTQRQTCVDDVLCELNVPASLAARSDQEDIQR